jgi:hypothetical protein
VGARDEGERDDPGRARRERDGDRGEDVVIPKCRACGVELRFARGPNFSHFISCPEAARFSRREVMYDVAANRKRYRLGVHRPYREKMRGTCRAGFGCPNPADYVASSPSFEAKPMCTYHAGQWALRHGIDVPGRPGAPQRKA